MYDSRFGFVNLKALSLKREMNVPLMKITTDRNIIKLDNYEFYFNKSLASIRI